MSETKWTPGPWKTEPFLSNPGNFTIIGPSDTVVTHVVIGDRAGAPPPSAVAGNARLIAAAPVMYEALSVLLGAVEDLIRDAGGVETDKVRSARTALARARGEP